MYQLSYIFLACPNFSKWKGVAHEPQFEATDEPAGNVMHSMNALRSSTLVGLSTKLTSLAKKCLSNIQVIDLNKLFHMAYELLKILIKELIFKGADAMLRKLIALLVVVSASISAHASSIYRFEATTPVSGIDNFSAWIQLADGVSGAVDYTLPSGCTVYGGCSHSDPLSPILRFYMSYQYSGVNVVFDMRPTVPYYTQYGELEARFAVNNGVFTNERFVAGDFQQGFGLQGQSLHIGTDFGACFLGCDGTGRFVLDEAASVPEPATLTLFGAGLLGAVSRRRSKDASKAK
jgi:hypothetical protein